MAHNRVKLPPQTRQQQSKQRDQGKHRVCKEQKTRRRSTRLNLECSKYAERSPSAKRTSQQRDLSTPQFRGQKRSREAEDEATPAPLSKRPRTSPESIATRSAGQETSSSSINPIDYWRKNKYTWPKEYFELDGMSHLLVRKKSTHSLPRKRSGSSLTATSTTPSDQKPREEKSAPYRNARYKTVLETKGSYLRNYVGSKEKGITDDSKRICQTLLETAQNVPKDSLFDDDIFVYTCNMIDSRNEAKVIQDITQLLVPSAQALAARRTELQRLTESVNEGWNNSIPLTGTRPQPDYSVGFGREAFSDDQFKKLSPCIGEFLSGDQSFFMATYYMYFPFLTCEVKCGAAALDIADRQNAHSMTLAVRAFVELFRLVGREKEIHREILAFSVSHDHRSVRIYGHYAVIDGAKTTFYRHPVHTFDFTALDGKDRWTAHKFVKNIYNVWMPIHFERLCSAIDDLPPELDFDVPSLSHGSGLPQGLESQTGDGDSRLGSGDEDEGDITPNTSFTGQGRQKSQRK